MLTRLVVLSSSSNFFLRKGIKSLYCESLKRRKLYEKVGKIRDSSRETSDELPPTFPLMLVRSCNVTRIVSILTVGRGFPGTSKNDQTRVKFRPFAEASDARPSEILPFANSSDIRYRERSSFRSTFAARQIEKFDNLH